MFHSPTQQVLDTVGALSSVPTLNPLAFIEPNPFQSPPADRPFGISSGALRLNLLRGGAIPAGW